MSKIFYDHLLEIEEVVAVLDEHKLTAVERKEILEITDQHLHHHVLNTILTHLPEDKHQEFLTSFHSAPHDKALLEYLKREISDDVEEKIRAAVKKARTEIISEIKKSR